MLGLRPVYHHKDERIHARVLLCFLALLLIRVAEACAEATCPNLRRELQRIHLGEFSGSADQVRQRTEITPAQAEILRALDVEEPPRFLEIEPAVAALALHARSPYRAIPGGMRDCGRRSPTKCRSRERRRLRRL